MSREQHIARTFVELADTLVEDFDVIDFLQQMTVRCQELLDITDAAVFLAHSGTPLYSPAPCDPGPGLARVLEVAMEEGPALEAYRTASPIASVDAADAATRWPRFTERVRQAGYGPPSVVPMRLRKESLGSLLLLHNGERALTADDLSLAQTLADAATIGLLHARTLRQQETVNTQLHTALHSRIVIEQAKGILAARRNIPLSQAFDAIRYYARHHRVLLSKVAQDVIDAGLVPPDPPAARSRNTHRKAAGGESVSG